jgi:hypothetical protein
MQFDQFYWAEKVADLGCSTAPLALEKLLPSAAKGRQDAATDILNVCQQQQLHSLMERDYDSPRTAAATAVQQAAAYLAVHIQAVMQHAVLESCRHLKEV